MTPPRSHPLETSRFSRWADRSIERMWARGMTPKPALEPEFLWQQGARGFNAQDESALRSPSEVSDFRERLEKLCSALREEASLNALGHTMAYGQITSAIRKRHQLGRLWCTRPELAQTDIAPPIIVLGQMRSGTTRIQRLLAADPAHAGTRFCNSHDPIPRLPIPWLKDWRPIKARAALFVARRVNPWLDALHPFGPARTDEEIGWLAGALSHCVMEAQYTIPSFIRWSEACNPAPIYREFARILRSDAAIMGNAQSPRILKCPQYTEDLPAMLAEFPNARLVIAKRGTEQVLPSSVSMIASQMAPQSQSIDLASLKAEWRRKLALRDERMQLALEGFKGRKAEVDFADLDRDWRGAMTQTYSALGIRLSDAGLRAMEQEQSRSAKSHYRKHQAQMKRFAQP